MVTFRRASSEADRILRAAAWPLIAGKTYERIVTWLGDADVVLLGEATRGTQDFHAARAALTRHLIEERGFSAVAVEGDWTDAYVLNRYIQGLGARDPATALASFTRFPNWTWRNTMMGEFAAWLHEHNQTGTEAQRAGLYGLDQFCLLASVRGVLEHLETQDPGVARAARTTFAAFDQYGDEPDEYAWSAGRLDELVDKLLALRQNRVDWLQHDGPVGSDEPYYLEQLARMTPQAERYYSVLMSSRREGWNQRSLRMAESLEELCRTLERRGVSAKVVVWAHNAQVAHDQLPDGRFGLAKVLRAHRGDRVRSIGFTAYGGSVLAAVDWGLPPQVCRLEPAPDGSVEDRLHRVGLPRFFLPLSSGADVRDLLNEPRLERGIGYVFRADQERRSHHFESSLSDRFDAIVQVEESRPLELSESAATVVARDRGEVRLP